MTRGGKWERKTKCLHGFNFGLLCDDWEEVFVYMRFAWCGTVVGGGWCRFFLCPLLKFYGCEYIPYNDYLVYLQQKSIGYGEGDTCAFGARDSWYEA